MGYENNTEVSWVNSATATETRPVKISWIISQIRGGDFSAKVNAIRFAKDKGDDQRVKMLKKGLPAILWSGLFNRRAVSGLIRHSGLIVADLDGLGSEIDAVRIKLLGSPHLLLLFVSPSGTGLKAVFRVSSDPSQHGASFQAVEDHVLQRTCIRIDASGKDVSRMCFISHDPDVFVNSTKCDPLLPRVSAPAVVVTTANVTPTHRHSEIPDTPKSQSYEGRVDVSWVKKYVPTAPHQTNALLFKIARHALAKEQELGRPLLPSEMQLLFDAWHAVCPPDFLSDTKQKYFEEFCRICGCAKKPLGESQLDQAWKRARAEPHPLEASYVSGEVKVLVALCCKLQEAGGEAPFYLSCRQVAELFQVEPMTAQRWLKQLEGLRILKCIKKGDFTSRQASEYRYMAAPLKAT